MITEVLWLTWLVQSVNSLTRSLSSHFVYLYGQCPVALSEIWHKNGCYADVTTLNFSFIVIVSFKNTAVLVHIYVWKYVNPYAVSLVGPIWSPRQAHTVRPRPGGALHKVCEGADRDRTELCQATQVCALSFTELVSECPFIFKWMHLCLCAFMYVCAIKSQTASFSLSNRSLTKKYAKRGSKEEQDCKWENNETTCFHYVSLNSYFAYTI